MRVEIFNVEHGQCAVVTAPNGARMMIDCGHRLGKDRWWSPSMRYMHQHFDLLATTNLDEDHLADFAELQKYVSIGGILTNPSIDAAGLVELKQSGFGKGTRAFHAWLASPFKAAARPIPDFGGLRIWWFCNIYNPQAGWSFTDTNNLSLVLIVSYGDFRIMFGGDLEDAGWSRLLSLPQFVEQLAGTNIFVASHHGRASGRSDTLFRYFRPDIVVMSDGRIQHDSQETDDWYRTRCNGAPLIANPSHRRYVLTTRRDGSLQFDVDLNRGLWTGVPVAVPDWPYRAPTANSLGALAGLAFS